MKLARLLVAAGALQLAGIGCEPSAPVIGPGDSGGAVDTPAGDSAAPDDQVTPEDRAAPQDQVSPEDRVAPADVSADIVADDAPAPVDVADGGKPDVAAGDAVIVEDVPPPQDAAGDVADATDAADAPTVECRMSADCATSMGGPVCDTATNRCVRCTATEDLCPVGNYCRANACVPGCRNDMDCSGGALCDTAAHACVNCRGDGDCAPGQICTANACVPGCSMTRPCGAGQSCCGSSCANLNDDAANCGACGNRCGAGQSCCGGSCVDPQGDVANCGACGRRCEAANGAPRCAAGACAVASCNAGFGDCDRSAANGCEVNLNTDAANCMTCGTACTAGGGATARCVAGACGVVCAAGSANCDGNPANGCEVNTNTSAANCGACANVCPARANASPTCAAGACGVACSAGFGNCDANATNGCEANTQTDVRNCGACARVCAFANASATCAAGVCGLGTCNTGFADCDGNPANGCEVNLTNTATSCGSCGRACAANAICFAGVCRDVCTAPLAVCNNNTCVDLQTDLANCGRCGAACTRQVANAQPTTCTAGACAISCLRGFGNCDGQLASGCEVNLLSTVAHCGACGNACNLPNAVAGCSTGACVISRCNTGFADCDGNPANGCETNVTNSGSNCGACGRVCAFANGTAACVNSACALTACDAGFANCDANAANGCELRTTSDSLNCGRCATRCNVGQACSSGACVASCPTGTTFCGGGCVSTQTDVRNCGACGTVCAAGATCTGGACVAVPPANDRLSGAVTLSLAAASFDFTATTTSARNDLPVPCLGSTQATSPDVYYRFVLSRREIVYADTYGATWDTVLFFVNDAGQAIASQVTGDAVCNDDTSSLCTGTGTNSRVVTVLPAGTWHLVVSGWNGASGVTTVHFEHVPAAGGTLTMLAQGASTINGRTSGASGVASATCGGTGPENGYWWTSCPPAMSGMETFSAESCGTAEFDTVLYLQNGNGFSACNDNGTGTCAPTSQLSVSYANTVRLHELVVDGFLTGNAGSYSVRVSRP